MRIKARRLTGLIKTVRETWQKKGETREYMGKEGKYRQ